MIFEIVTYKVTEVKTLLDMPNRFNFPKSLSG